MDRARRGMGVWRGVAQFGREQQPFCAAVLDEIRTRGPIGVSELGSGGKRREGWWGWSHGKIALSGCSGPAKSPRTAGGVSSESTT
jgi:uncharacterized protein YcaQ